MLFEMDGITTTLSSALTGVVGTRPWEGHLFGVSKLGHLSNRWVLQLMDWFTFGMPALGDDPGLPRAFGLLLNYFLLCSGLVLMLIYPMRETLSVLEHPSSRGLQQWLSYWFIFALFSLAEASARTIHCWCLAYTVARLAFITWLVLPPFSGAQWLLSLLLRLMRISIPASGSPGILTLREDREDREDTRREGSSSSTAGELHDLLRHEALRHDPSRQDPLHQDPLGTVLEGESFMGEATGGSERSSAAHRVCRLLAGLLAAEDVREGGAHYTPVSMVEREGWDRPLTRELGRLHPDAKHALHRLLQIGVKEIGTKETTGGKASQGGGGEREGGKASKGGAGEREVVQQGPPRVHTHEVCTHVEAEKVPRGMEYEVTSDEMDSWSYWDWRTPDTEEADGEMEGALDVLRGF